MERPDPVTIIETLAREGFSEFKREIIHGAPGTPPVGGLWEGLDPRSGAVASVLWAMGADDGAHVFVEVAGTPLTHLHAA